MIIQNCIIEFKKTVERVIDPETGYRSQSSETSWGDPQPCNVKPVKMNLLAKALGGEHFTELSYEVYVEEDTAVESGRVRLKHMTGKELGEFSISKIELLEAVGMIKILV